MDLLLFSGPHRNFFVISEPTTSGDEDHSTTGRLAELKRKTHEAYDSLKQRFDPQENVCAALRHAEKLRILHSETVTADQAGLYLKEFLESASSKHRLWMWIDLTLALFGSLLTPIPGPNVFFLYPAARALSHYFALKGTRVARQIELLSFGVERSIDSILEHLGNLDQVKLEIDELEEKYNIRNLRYLLERI